MKRRLAAVALTVAALLGISTAPAQGSAHTPSFHLVFADGFNTPTRLGSFSGCDHNDDTPTAYCSGLAGSVRANWWAYPAGWPDTATQRNYPVGGYYDPATTLWVAPSPWGDGQLHIRMWRGAAGPVHSAAIVPKQLMGLRYGKFEERWRVSKAASGYKSAHLLWPDDNAACPNCEIDFPEGDWTGRINGYAHHENAIDGDQDAYNTTTGWTSWHTTDIIWQPGSVTFELDGRVVGHSTTAVPNTAMSWIIQNETALDGPLPAPNTSAQMDVTYVKGWAWS
ncbi:glycoside hydrolase family 16 protein [Streptomyces sp. NPDC054933]